jgi:hypothetical protein
MGNDSFGNEKGKVGGDTFDYLGGGKSKSKEKDKDSFLDGSKSSLRGSINAYNEESSDLLQG